MTHKKVVYYEISMSILAVIAVTFAFIDISKGLYGWEIIADNVILIVFILDYVIRLYLAKEKKKFVQNNVMDLIAIIPFNSAFRIFRIF